MLADKVETPHKQKGWFETFTGRKFSILDPQPEDVDIRDIAHALALTCRYGGMCSHFYSVAQHSMSVSENSDNKLWGLLHDAAEAYIGDMPKPFKEFMTNFDETESRILAVISDKFGLERQIPEDVHVADKRMLLTEATILLPGCSWVHDYPEKRYEHVKIKYMGPKRAEREFHRMFSDLYY